MLKRFLAAALLAGAGAIAWSFTGETLPTLEPPDVTLPPADPPPSLAVWTVPTGGLMTRAALAYRGGAFGDRRELVIGAVLVEHPEGRLLIDAGFAEDLESHVATLPLPMQKATRVVDGPSAATQLAAAGLAPADLRAVVLTHAHWDHVSGLAELPGVPVWVSPDERLFIRGGNGSTELARELGLERYRPVGLDGPAYLGFPGSRDVFGDGSVVLVPLPGHTPGGLGVFVALPSGERYAFVGDVVWQREGLILPAERPWLMRTMVDEDPALVRDAIVRLHALAAALPALTLVPAHDARVWAELPALDERPR
jgi:glyoxylase-like metal-dependent hydrolase (beta-lactamase superfamily II)